MSSFIEYTNCNQISKLLKHKKYKEYQEKGYTDVLTTHINEALKDVPEGWTREMITTRIHNYINFSLGYVINKCLVEEKRHDGDYRFKFWPLKLEEYDKDVDYTWPLKIHGVCPGYKVGDLFNYVLIELKEHGYNIHDVSHVLDSVNTSYTMEQAISLFMTQRGESTRCTVTAIVMKDGNLFVHECGDGEYQSDSYKLVDIKVAQTFKGVRALIPY